VLLLIFAKKICILLITGIFLITGAYGEAVSTGGGTKVEVSDYSSSQGAYTTDGMASQTAVSSSGVIDNIDINHWVKNAVGDVAGVGVQAKNADGFSYNYVIHPGEGSIGTSEAVWAEEWLSINTASYIKAFSYANNAIGDKACAEIVINEGSLKGYYGAAYSGAAPWLGISRGAFVQQMADYATGAEVVAQLKSQNIISDASTSYSRILIGNLDDYSARSESSKFTTSGKVTCSANLDLMKASAPEGSIYNLMQSDCFLGDNSRVSILVNKGNLYSYPNLKGLPSSTIVESGILRKTYASQSFEAEPIGDKSYIEIKGHSYSPATIPYNLYEKLFNFQSMSNNAWTT